MPHLPATITKVAYGTNRLAPAVALAADAHEDPRSERPTDAEFGCSGVCTTRLATVIIDIRDPGFRRDALGQPDAR